MPSAHPLDWPSTYERTKAPKAAAFKTSFGRARDNVRSELDKLSATAITISTNLPLKRNGEPYASRVVLADPGVAVYFTPAGGRPSVVACDAWNQPEDNMQAIARTLEALRALDRWGTTQVRQAAYAGLQLPAFGQSTAPVPAWPVGEEPWWEVLQVSPDASAEVIREAARDHLARAQRMVNEPEKKNQQDRLILARGRGLDARRGHLVVS